MCPRDWHPYQDKCLHLSQTSGPWSEGLTYCSVKEATLLLIENEEELVNCSVEHITLSLSYVDTLTLTNCLC